jgi:hypothetical protein
VLYSSWLPPAIVILKPLRRQSFHVPLLSQ